jgi:hypothetical protein
MAVLIFLGAQLLNASAVFIKGILQEHSSWIKGILQEHSCSSNQMPVRFEGIFLARGKSKQLFLR